MKIASLATSLGLVALLSAGGLNSALASSVESPKKADVYNLGLQVGDRNTDRAFTWYTKKSWRTERQDRSRERRSRRQTSRKRPHR